MNPKEIYTLVFLILLIISYLVCFNIFQENEKIDQLKIDNAQMNLILNKMMR